MTTDDGPAPRPAAGAGTGRRALHGSFTMARRMAAPPKRVFAGFADPPLRRQWFRVPGTSSHELDFRVGGHERASGVFAAAGDPERIDHHARFLDIVPDERIVFGSELRLNGRRRSVSIVTVELTPDTGGTLLNYTEQYVFLAYTADGHADIAEREGGTRLMLNRFAAVIEQDPR